jgi:integrase
MPRTHNKKSPSQPTSRAAIEAWASSSRWQTPKVVARDAIAAFGHLAPDQLNPFIIGALVSNWKKRHKRSTVHSYRASLQNLMAALCSFGAPPIRVPRVPQGPPRGTIATGDELARLLANPQPWMRLFILLYLQCGLRKSEALAVTPRSWDRENHCVRIPVKGGAIRTAEVTADVEILFLAAGDPDPDTSYITALRGHAFTNSSIHSAWQDHRKKCGVNPALNAHDLRRTAATILYTLTKDLRIPQQLLGHQSLATTCSASPPSATRSAGQDTSSRSGPSGFASAS